MPTIRKQSIPASRSTPSSWIGFLVETPPFYLPLGVLLGLGQRRTVTHAFSADSLHLDGSCQLGTAGDTLSRPSAATHDDPRPTHARILSAAHSRLVLPLPTTYSQPGLLLWLLGPPGQSFHLTFDRQFRKFAEKFSPLRRNDILVLISPGFNFLLRDFNKRVANQGYSRLERSRCPVRVS